MDYPRATTEGVLGEWRFGQTQAERLCASLLMLEGYNGVDPQAPLGGPDGGKDILAYRNGRKIVGACTFPSTEKDYAAIENKFIGDVRTAKKHNPYGIAFFVNKRLKLEERQQLKAHATSENLELDLFHQERIRALLDAPRGYGIRLEYLRIPMTPEEQLDFWTQSRIELSDALNQQALEFRALVGKIDALAHTHSAFLERLELISPVRQHIVDPTVPPPKAGVTSAIATGQLSVPILCMLHRALCFETTTAPVGILRDVQVWIGPVGSTPETASFTPPSPELIPLMVNGLVEHWTSQYPQISEGSRESKIDSIARFHHGFLSMHPFQDGNGRIARFLLWQQAIELLDRQMLPPVLEGQPYFDALQEAHRGNLNPLTTLVDLAIRSALIP
jgi:fido (protein-threonine AMPylation protein)